MTPDVGFDFNNDTEDGIIHQTTPDADDAPSRGTRGKTRRTRRPKFAKVRDEIRGDVEQLSGVLSLILAAFSPTAAEYNERNLEKTIDDMARLCIRHPRLLEIIKQTGDVGAYAGIAQYIAGMAICVLVDRERLDPNFIVARALRVTEAYAAVHGLTLVEEKENDAASTPPGSGDAILPPLLAGTAPDGA